MVRARSSIAERPFMWLDVFTDEPLAGNGLAVVADADGLSDAAMQALARETRLSETTFVQTASDHRADYRLRIWTPCQEMPLAGHPSLGSAVAVARWRGVERATFHQQTPAGVQPVSVDLGAEGAASAEMLQQPPVRGHAPPAAALLRALGLSGADAAADLPVATVSTGYPTVLVPLRTIDALGRVEADHAALRALLPERPQPNVYAFATDAEGIRARCFAPTEGEEDPATGSAAGPLAVYAREHLGLASVDVRQGIEMGRPSRLWAAVEGDRPRVGGRVVPIMEGTVVACIEPRRTPRPGRG